jgi:DNA-binding XRE family transcriptional regulator/predicted RNase H-like HicB family nuclease
MHYVATITREGRHWLAEFPDAPGCQTFASSEKGLHAMAQDALEGWLRAHLVSGDVPDRPKRRAVSAKAWAVPVGAGLSVAVQLRWARHDAGLSQKDAAEQAGVTQQQIAKLENPKSNPSIETIAKVCRALGVPLDVVIGAPTKTRGRAA